MDKVFMNMLQWVRDKCGFPFFVISGFRCFFHNNKYSNNPTSDHTQGLGIDIKVNNDR
jgi:uncharacterized protein YcbK (DUF882 family)